MKVKAMSVGNEITNTSPLIEWGVAVQSFAGQAESGDQYLIEPFPNGVLAAVVDGLGHGPIAAAVAQTAVAVLKGHAHEPVISLLKRCDKGLRRTRGAVMSLASFDARNGTITWLGVGNVRGLLLRADAKASPAREPPVLSKACPEPRRERDERPSRRACPEPSRRACPEPSRRACPEPSRRVEELLLRGGVVGCRLPLLRPAVIPVVRGDTLVFATDGICSGFTEELTLGDTPQQMADRILARRGSGMDDALVLVVRYIGGLSQALS